MPRFKDQAICIRCQEWSETSQIVTLLTQHHGAVGGIAKGAKRTSPGAVARYSGGFALLTLGQVVGITKATSDLATLTEWDLQQPYPHLRRDLRAMHIALYAAELTRAMLAEHDPHPNVFTGLSRLLDHLTDPPQREPALLGFQWGLLEDCGYRPSIENDVSPSSTADDGGNEPWYWFDAHAGGLVDQSQTTTHTRRGGRAGRWRVRGSTIETLRGFMSRTPLSTQGGEGESVQRANRLLARYARVILDRQLKTVETVFGKL